jgi:mannose-6-phosphate isomerase-like protein (cupin superfamily)
MKIMLSASLLGMVLGSSALAPAASGPHDVMDALRWAKQAEVAGAAQDPERFVEQTDRALQAARGDAGELRDHREAESVHALMEALALGRQGKVAEGREDLQSAIVWLSRAAGLPVASPSADWSMNERQGKISSSAGAAQGKESTMDHFLIDIEQATRRNDHFRQVLFTASHSQLVLMSLKPGEDIGTETHQLDQFIRVEEGEGTARLNGKDYPLKDGSALVIPAGTEHNVINQGTNKPLKLYTIYSPPEHKDATIHPTKREAEQDKDDHFDGKTTAMLQASQASR